MFTAAATTSVPLDSDRMEQALRQFGVPNLKPRQLDAVEARLAGRDVLAVLPTNYGKTLAFQLPGVLLGQRTLVVSPLIALQEDQTRKLRKAGFKAFAYHSNLNVFQQAAVHHYYKTAPKDEPSFLYISPELLLKETFHERFNSIGFGHGAVDEVHCVSTWGDAFRPEYQRIGVAFKRLGIPGCSAFTATVDPKIEEDIRARIPLRPDYARIVEDPMRPNIELRVERIYHENDTNQQKFKRRFHRLLTLLKDPNLMGPTIIYYNSLSSSAGLYLRFRKMIAFLQETGYTPHLFHSELPFEDKDAVLKGFMRDKKPLVIATSAFGMGIDRADIRQIIHYKTPTSLIEYAQQFGRGGRDGLRSVCTTFHSKGDENEEFMNDRVSFEIPTYETVERIYGRLRARVDRLEDGQRRSYNLMKFLRAQEHLITTSDQIRYKSNAITRLKTAVALLEQCHLVEDGEQGIVLHPLLAGTPKHLNLLERTKMRQRMMVRERQRVQTFFGAKEPTQQMLWDILKQE